ncbi:outer membrane beta-barrel protein [Pontibacter indicus]|uniref:Outer membrane protein beta-barrel domain-containing protein n=1 Tax=Pontibacter indicus TaxID=1317125 RepID=A0A1R3XP73_9BACT|nr:outer membrane beta-barrel protein [Pontibacter indicus]SIT93711.1 hypothetical protein SAMN05444128_3165 [Pontibacter indicus]
MKQLLLLFICSLAFNLAQAQMQSSTSYVGGTLGGSYSEPNSLKVSSFHIKPIVGRFVTDNWLIGISASYQSNYRSSNSHTVYTIGENTYHMALKFTRERSVGIGPVARYYQEVGPKLAFFAEGTAGYAKKDTKQEYTIHSTDANGTPTLESYDLRSVRTQHLYAGFAPGIVFFPKPKLGIELKANVISYTHGIGNGPNQDPLTFMFDQNTQKNLNVNFSLASTSIGVGYYF